jgi:ABC-type branched-subunit amino acid transport system substrate-binding protein
MVKKILGLLLAVFLVTTANEVVAVDGVTDTEVSIGISTPLSGPAALWGLSGLGAKAWADYINEKGGIHGRKINVILRDDGYNPARALANLTAMKGEVFSVTALLGAAVVRATKDLLAENKIPLILPLCSARLWENVSQDKRHWVFSTWPDSIDEAEFLANYGVSALGGKKVSIFYQNDEMGQPGLKGVNQALSKLTGRASLGVAIPYEVTERALATHALKLKEGGADILLLYTTPTHGAIILKEMAKINYHPKVLTVFALGDPIMYTVAGADVWEGVYPAVSANISLPGEPEADRVIDILKKYEPKIAGKEYMALVGSVSMMYVVEGLKNAGRNLTPETMVEGMEKIKNWKPEGMGAPTTFGPDRRHGVNGIRIMHAEKGKHVPVTDYAIFKPLF